jgi:hypothetical protein
MELLCSGRGGRAHTPDAGSPWNLNGVAQYESLSARVWLQAHYLGAFADADMLKALGG